MVGSVESQFNTMYGVKLPSSCLLLARLSTTGFRRFLPHRVLIEYHATAGRAHISNGSADPTYGWITRCSCTTMLLVLLALEVPWESQVTSTLVYVKSVLG